MTMRINNDGGVSQARAPAKSEASQAAERPAERPQFSPAARNQLVDSFEARGRTFDKLLGESRALDDTASGSQASAGAGEAALDETSGAGAATATSAATGAQSPEEARQALVDAKKTYDDAHKKVAELNDQLAQELTKLGPALTAEQKQKYIQEFREKYADEYGAEETAAKDLNAALNDPKLLEAARANPDVAREAVDAAKALAGSPGAKGAIEWATKALDPNGPAGAAFEGFKDQIDDDVIASALSTVAGQLLTENGGDAQAALAQLQEMVTPLMGLSKGGAAIRSGLQTIQQAVASGSPQPLMELSRSSSKLGIALTGVGVAFGLANAIKDGREGDWANVVKDLAGAGRGGAQIAATVMRTLGESGRIAAATGEKAAQWLGRLAPALGVVANAVVLADHFKDFLDDPTVGSGVQAFGDAVAVAGAAIGTVLPGVGHIVEGVGLLVSAFGGLLMGREKDQRLSEEEEALLKEAGVDPDVARTLAFGQDQPKALAEQLGLSPEQIQQLAKNYPTMFEAPGLGQATIDAAKACGMKGEEAMGFIDALGKDDPDFAWDLLGIKPMMPNEATHPTAAADTWRAYVQGRYPSAFAYAQEHAPELFGKDAETRLQADRDYDINAGSMDYPLVYARLCDEHKDNPVYTSELVRRMKQDGSLDNFVRFIDENGLDMDRSGARAAVEAALQTGVLTQAELQGFLDGDNGGAWRSILGR